MAIHGERGDPRPRDDTATQAELARAWVIRRPYNIGNGAGVKTGVRTATGDVVVVIDGDGQHDPAAIQLLLEHIEPYDMLIGTGREREPANVARWLGNYTLNTSGLFIGAIIMFMFGLLAAIRLKRLDP